MLKDLPKEVERPVMIPLGASAFIPGKIRHTNEVFVKLDQHYLKTSAFHARRSIARRVLRLEAQHSLPPSRPSPLDRHHRHKHCSNQEENFAPKTGDIDPSATAPNGSTTTPELLPGVAENTVVHRSDDGTVHILEFPSFEAEVTATTGRTTQPAANGQKDSARQSSPPPQQQQGRRRQDEVLRAATGAPSTLPPTSTREAADAAATSTPPSQVHHNADGTVTILEFPDAGPGQQPELLQQPSNLRSAASERSLGHVETVESEVSKLRLEGNEAFQQKDFETAIQNYTQCIEMASGPNQPPELCGQLHVLLANRAASYTAVQKFSAAITDATQAIVERPEYGLRVYALRFARTACPPITHHFSLFVSYLWHRYTKAYHRLAQAQIGQGRLESAALTYEKAVAMDPNNASLKKFLGKVVQAMQKAQNSEAEAEAQREADNGEQHTLPMQLSPIQEREALCEEIHAPVPTVPKRRSLFAQRMRSHS